MEWSLKSKLKLASEAGFSGIELNLEETGAFSMETNLTGVKGVQKLVSSYNLEITSISTSLLWKYPITDNDPEIREIAKTIIRKMLLFAKILAIDTILIVPGVVDAEVSYDQAYERSKDILRELAEDAKECKVSIAIENVWNKFLLSPLEMKGFIEEIQSEYIRVYFDVGNILNYGYPEQWISILGPLIKKVHVKDFKTEIGNIHGFTSLFHGDVNWYKVMQALRTIKYNDYITAEIMPSLEPEKMIYEISHSMDELIKGGQI
ncbi:sugar phosphate isomerase/epimerase family protein [Bacillus massilinigeriensis]|uniref:sugar phosphate isomerase/epimerase family protein n=1 Tax=Bacillus massilionigeriensis TaxID=1805475 RepID=UPI00096B18E6|nr:sugar phosphate isomerase/epimerase family protein [Bacillus massilionigeriensis]